MGEATIQRGEEGTACQGGKTEARGSKRLGNQTRGDCL
jgi:hypothetical protein